MRLKPAAIIATPAPIPTAAIPIAPPRARIFPIPAVLKANPNARMTGANPERAILIPSPIPVAAVLIAVPVVLIRVEIDLKI